MLILLVFLIPALCHAEEKGVEKFYKYSLYFLKPNVHLEAEGKLSETVYQKEFKADYLLIGERISTKERNVVGVLIVWSNENQVVLPIFEWEVEPGKKIMLCQSSSDGSAPRLSVQASDKASLLREIRKRLQ